MFEMIGLICCVTRLIVKNRSLCHHRLVAGSQTLTNGAGEAKSDAHLRLLSYPHDIIAFSASPINTNFPEFFRLYEKGLSLSEISRDTGFPKSSIRTLLIQRGVELRANSKEQKADPKKPQRAFWGSIPYGFNVLDGQLVVDPKETKVIRKIMAMHSKGVSFNAIAKSLTQDKIPSKTGRKWSDKTIAAIIRRTKPE